MEIKDLVPPLEMCRPIAHLFPDSIFSWHKRCDLGCENWFIHRSDIGENQTPSGQNKLGPSPDRWKERSKTYQGVAQAMAEQWGTND